MTQIDPNSSMYIDKITRLDFFEKHRLEHYVYLRVYLQIFKINLYRSVKRNFYRERKKYLQECDSERIKDVIKIRLRMWQVSCNYKRDNTGTKCPLCKKSEDTTKHVLECEKDKKFTLSKEKSKGEWEEITEIYRKNKTKRELAVIKVQDQDKIIKESREKQQNKKNKRERKM